MKLEALLAALVACLVQKIIRAEVLELSEDEQGTPVWKNGEYRDRNEIPLPPSYDEEKKHKRDVSTSQEADLKSPKSKTTKKNLINRVHFALPFGVDLPIYHVSKGWNKKGKKSKVPNGNRGRSDRLKLDDMYEYAKLDVQTPYRKSDVSKGWGMTYEDVFHDKPKETTGRSRSNLEAGYKITEEDLDSGMMFRGLGGLKLRDQNHQIIEGKFADEENDEMDTRSDVSQPVQPRGLFHFSHLFNHHYHRPHRHHYKPSSQRGQNERKQQDSQQQPQQLQPPQQQQQSQKTIQQQEQKQQTVHQQQYQPGQEDLKQQQQ